MALTVSELADHITTRRKFYALALETDIELLRRAYGESVVQEALRLADGAAEPQAPPQVLPPANPDLADALDRVMRRGADHVAASARPNQTQGAEAASDIADALDAIEGVVQEAVRLADEAAQPQTQSNRSTFVRSPAASPHSPQSAAPHRG